jgi:hypothetical protein
MGWVGLACTGMASWFVGSVVLGLLLARLCAHPSMSAVELRFELDLANAA